MDYSHLSDHTRVNEGLFAHASLKRESSLEFLNRLCDLCRPNCSEEHVLLFIARIAMRTWLRGCIRLDIHHLGNFLNALILTCDDGQEEPEIIFENELKSSFSKFRLIGEDTMAVQPFVLYEATEQRLAFEALPVRRISTLPPAPFLDANARINNCADLSYQSIYPPWDEDPDGEAVTRVRNLAKPLHDVIGIVSQPPKISLPKNDEDIFDKPWDLKS